MEKAEQIRTILKGEESYLKRKYNFEVAVYGTKKKGYDSLWEFMHEGSSVLFPRKYCYKCGSRIVKTKKGIECPNCYTQYFLKSGVYKKAYEYWTFLMFLVHVLEGIDLTHYEGQRWIRYQPCEGGLDQEYAAVSFPNYSIFVEPALPDFNKEDLYQRYKLKLGGTLLKTSTAHVKPDFLILKGEYSEIGIPPISQGWFVESKKIEYQKRFSQIKPDIKWIVECKNEPVTEEDISQFLWYAIAYKSPTILISQLGLDKFKPTLEDVLEKLREEGIICHVIENFKVGEKENCSNKIKGLFT